jgi:Ca2+/H+ antiporter, TMEM165/GDT1 family
MEAFLVSTLAVAIAEIGDKTQLLSLLLATRFRKPLPIVFGILVATVANHALAALAGEWVRANLSPETLRWILGAGFLAIAAWTLKPDKLDDEDPVKGTYGVFLITLVAFFVAEMGDKTQIATIALSAKYGALVPVVLGTTAGMLLVNVPIVYLGDRFAPRIPLKLIRVIAAGIFAAIGLTILLGVGGG